MYLKLITLSVFIGISIPAQDTKPDFGGTWVYRLSPFNKKNEVDRISQNEKEFKISEKVGMADVIYTVIFSTDGQELKTVSSGNEVIRSGHWDGNTFNLDTKWISGGEVTTKREELSLSDDGKLMIKTVRRTGREPRAEERIEFKKVSAGIAGIKIGDSEVVVRHEWGEPESVEHRGDVTVYLYKSPDGPMEVLFLNGKMTDGMLRKFDKDAPKNDP